MCKLAFDGLCEIVDNLLPAFYTCRAGLFSTPQTQHIRKEIYYASTDQ